MAADVKIDIAAEFVGKKAFKQADVATAKLSRGVKSLAASLGLAFGARGIGRAVKAFAEDDKAARALGQTLNNLGLAYGSNTETVNGYISRLEMQTGVLDDELRPAMDRLLRATGDVAKSQELLNLALDIAAGTGKSVTQVSQSLQKAYLGQTQALGRLGVGLSKAELTSSSFEEIQARLSVLFAGQASTAANTYAGELAKLQVAANNAKETIGKGFVDALKTASGSSTIEPVISAIGKIANAFAGLTRETGKFIAITKDAFTSFDLFAPEGGYGNRSKGMGNISMSVSSQDTQKADLAARKKADAVSAASALKLANLQKTAIKTQQDAFKLTKAKSIFDLEKIQIEAALKGKLTEEERIRLKLMKAIADENADAIDKLLEQLKTAQTKTAEMQKLLDTIKTLEIKDPFGTWKIDPLTTSINELVKSMFSVQSQIQANGREWSSFSSAVAGTSIKPNLGEWNSSFSAAGKSAADAIAAGAKAAQDAAQAQIKAAQDTADAQAALLTAGSVAQKAALEAQLKSQQEALAAQSAAQLAALKARLADEATAYAELAAATQANAEAQFTLGANDSATRNAAILAAQAAAQAAAAAAALAASEQALANNAGNATTASKVEITVNAGVGDPNAIAEAIQQVINEAVARGTLDLQAIA
jgi:hypothetical protein